MEKELEEDNTLMSLGAYKRDICGPKNMVRRVSFLDEEDGVFSTSLWCLNGEVWFYCIPWLMMGRIVRWTFNAWHCSVSFTHPQFLIRAKRKNAICSSCFSLRSILDFKIMSRIVKKVDLLSSHMVKWNGHEKMWLCVSQSFPCTCLTCWGY